MPTPRASNSRKRKSSTHNTQRPAPLAVALRAALAVAKFKRSIEKQDPITLAPFGKSRGIRLNTKLYSKNAILQAMNHGMRFVPHTRRALTPNELRALGEHRETVLAERLGKLIVDAFSHPDRPQLWATLLQMNGVDGLRVKQNNGTKTMEVSFAQPTIHNLRMHVVDGSLPFAESLPSVDVIRTVHPSIPGADLNDMAFLDKMYIRVEKRPRSWRISSSVNLGIDGIATKNAVARGIRSKGGHVQVGR